MITHNIMFTLVNFFINIYIIMKETIFSVICIFAFLLIIIYVIYKLINVKIKEGMTDLNVNLINVGISDKSDIFASKIKSTNIKLQDKLLINKYKQNYEKIILNLDDLINSIMLEKVLSININQKDEMMKTLRDINSLTESKNNLNTIIKFVDSY
jgi:hypothetical protein